MRGSSDYTIRIQRKGRPIQEVIKVFQNKMPSNVRLNRIKEQVLAHLQTYINSQKHYDVMERPASEEDVNRLTQRNNLYNTIEAGTTITEHITPDGHYKYYLSIGEERFLQEHAPYWKVVNYGGYVPPPVIGYFGAGKAPRAFAGEVFHATGKYKGTNPYTRSKKSFLMIPKKPITGMYYLEEMAKAFSIEMQLIKERIQR